MRGGSASLAAPSTAPFNAPIQVWACGNPEHRHIAKSEAIKCIETGNAAVEKTATDGAAAAQAQVDEALASVEAGKTALAELEKRRGEQPAEDATKGGDAPGDGSKPYGDEEYADNGLRADGKKRYPLTEGGKPSEDRIRSAWNYINHTANCA